MLLSRREVQGCPYLPRRELWLRGFTCRVLLFTKKIDLGSNLDVNELPETKTGRCLEPSSLGRVCRTIFPQSTTELLLPTAAFGFGRPRLKP